MALGQAADPQVALPHGAGAPPPRAISGGQVHPHQVTIVIVWSEGRDDGRKLGGLDLG